MELVDRLLNRRQMLGASLAAAATAAWPRVAAGTEGGSAPRQGAAFASPGRPSLTGLRELRFPFSLPDLPYGHDALDAAIDARTMEIHHGRHHQGYVNRLNQALEGHSELHNHTLLELVSSWNGLPDTVKSAVRNHGGGHLNHTLFWSSMSPGGGGEPRGGLAGAIRSRFGSFESFKEEFSGATGSIFGSGWGWLVEAGGGRLEVVTTPNQDNPVSMGMTPLLGLDVWEHAYYLRYQNRRGDYIQAFWDVVNWDEVSRRFRES